MYSCKGMDDFNNINKSSSLDGERFMIRTILVDDESLALIYLEQLLKEFANIQIVAAFTDPIEAVQSVSELNPELIFLDIDMPGMHGMQAADQIQQQLPDCEIVFVTAYNQYALEAFEISALDYVLKPIQKNRLKKTIDRLQRRRTQTLPPQDEQSSESVIRCLHMLQFEKTGEKAQSLRWRTSKSEELFSYLLHHRKGFVSKEALSDILWPDVDSKKAMTSLYTTIYLIRKTLSEAAIPVTISNVGGHSGYALELDHYKIDVDIWEEALQKLEPIDGDNVLEHQKWLDYYNGDYFGEHYYVWAENERQRLSWLWRNHAGQLAEYYSKQSMLTEAIAVYQKIIDIQPLNETNYWQLMKFYDKLGESEAIEVCYRQLRRTLQEELDEDVTEELQEWYEAWKAGRKENQVMKYD